MEVIVVVKSSGILKRIMDRILDSMAGLGGRFMGGLVKVFDFMLKGRLK